MIDQAVIDEIRIAKQDLGWIGRLRFQAAGVIGLVAMKIGPKEINEVILDA